MKTIESIFIVFPFKKEVKINKVYYIRKIQKVKKKFPENIIKFWVDKMNKVDRIFNGTIESGKMFI
jgi:hypothetical protein